MEGSATAYLIEYADYLSGINCASDVISADSCYDGICSHLLTAGPSSPCSVSVLSGFTVTVSAQSILGTGPKSQPLIIIVPQIDGMIT